MSGSNQQLSPEVGNLLRTVLQQSHHPLNHVGGILVYLERGQNERLTQGLVWEHMGRREGGKEGGVHSSQEEISFRFYKVWHTQ